MLLYDLKDKHVPIVVLLRLQGTGQPGMTVGKSTEIRIIVSRLYMCSIMTSWQQCDWDKTTSRCVLHTTGYAYRIYNQINE